MSAHARHDEPPSQQAYRPIIFLTSARSASSVCAAMLGQHPEAYGFPELNLFGGETVADALAADVTLPAYVRRANAFGLVRAVAEVCFGDQETTSMRQAIRWVADRAAASTGDVLRDLFGRVAPRVPVEKSPVTTTSDANLMRALRLFPAARYVHLVRHPIPTIASMIRHWGGWGDGERLGAAFPADVARRWLEVQRRVLQMTQRLPGTQVVRVRAEDILATPVETLHKLASELELRTEDDAIQMMLRPEASPFATPGGGNDPGFLEAPQPRRLPLPRQTQAPKSWDLSAEMVRSLSDVGRQLGYD